MTDANRNMIEALKGVTIKDVRQAETALWQVRNEAMGSETVIPPFRRLATCCQSTGEFATLMLLLLMVESDDYKHSVGHYIKEMQEIGLIN